MDRYLIKVLIGFVAGMAAVPLVASGSFAAPVCTKSGTSSDDVIVGTRGSDVLCGLEGNDFIRGERGDDRLFGGRGADDLDGGPGRGRCSRKLGQGFDHRWAR
jgi:Ca2+-binding RTX toxin-like protein